MKLTSLLVTGLVAVVLIGAALMLSHQSRRASAPTERLFPGLLAVINEVAEFRMSTRGGTGTILRDGDVWVVKEKHGYPADPGKVREALIGLAELDILEAKTAKPDRYEQLGVRDADAEGSSSMAVTLLDAEGRALAELLVGHARPAGDQSGRRELFVRKPGHPQTWLVIGRFSVDHNPDEWLDRAVLRLEPKRVRRVTVTHPDRTRLTLAKETPDDLDYQVVNLPEGREIRSQFTVNNIVSTMASLSLEDVRPKSDVDVDETAGVVATLETFDGFEGTVTLFQRDETAYATVSASFNAALVREPEPDARSGDPVAAPEQPATASDQPEAEQDAVPKTPAIKPAEDVKAEINALTRTAADWVYVIPTFSADAILTRPADLLAPPDA